MELSREGRPSSHTRHLQGLFAPSFFTSGASQKWTLLPTGSTIVGAQTSLQFRRRQALGLQDSGSKFLGVLEAAGSVLNGSKQFGVLGRP